MKHAIWWTVAAAALIGHACADKPPAAAPALGPDVPKIQTVSLQDPDGWIGVVVAREAVDLAAEVEGRLNEVFARTGDAVEAGALIATTDPTSVRDQLDSTQAALLSATADEIRYKTEYSAARARYDRRQRLADAVSQEELSAAAADQEVAEAVYASAKARVAQYKAQVNELEGRLQRTRVIAPFAGTIATRLRDPGAWVAAGTPIVSLISSETLVRFAMPAEFGRQAEVGWRIRLRAHGSNTFCCLGEILRVAPDVEPASNMVVAEASLEDRLGALRVGQRVDVTVAR